MEFKSKKIFIFLSLLVVGGALFYYFQKDHSPTGESWVTFKKTTPKKVDSYPTTPEEKEVAKLPTEESKPQRTPASTKPAPIKKARKSLPGREWNLFANQKIPKKISFKNEPKEDWKALMGQDIMRFLRPDTKLFVKKEKSLTILERDGGLHVEQVYIKMISPEGRQYSYQAYVNSETGKVIKTWNRTIHEPMGKETPKFRPTGIINPNGSEQF